MERHPTPEPRHPLLLHAYAKINLTLDVFSKRADGYHSIASVMQSISLHDTLTLTRSAAPGIVLTCDAPADFAVPTDESNLAFRAVKIALDAAQWRGEGGVAIHLEKKIPAQAGMGGGSSDAAAALVGVNRLLNLGLDEQKMRGLAASLGSDVPFFLLGGAAAARGRGEILTPLPDIEPFWLVVVKPDAGVSTGWAYDQLDADPNRASHRATKRFEEALQSGDRDRLIQWQSNDFELPVFAHYPDLAWLHDELRMAGAVTAHLCGSGSAIYGVAESEAQARKIASLMQAKYPRVYVAQTLSRAASQSDLPTK